MNSHRTRRTAALALCASLALALILVPAFGNAAAPAQPRCTITGTQGDDMLSGTRGDDTICGLGGDDTIRGLGGVDLLLGGAGADWANGGGGDDIVLGGPGVDRLRGGAGSNVVRQGTLKNDRTFDVHAISTYDVPAGTKITWAYRGGNCTKNEDVGSFVYDPSKQSGDYGHYFAKAEGSCAFEKSNARYNVSFETPGGQKKDVDIDLAQGSSPNIYIRAFHIDCGAGSIGCDGGSDTEVADFGSVRVPVKFGPLRDPDPKPDPPQDPSLNCGGTFHFPVGVPIVDKHVCTSEGNPLPTLAYEGKLPNGVKASRYPPGVGSWIVLNGTPQETGTFNFQIRASIANPRWEKVDSALIVVDPR